MMYKFGDKEVNIIHVHAVGEPYYDDYGFYIDCFFVGGKVRCDFEIIKNVEDDWEVDTALVEEFKSTSPLYRKGLKLMNGKTDWNVGRQDSAYRSFTHTIIYDRMKKEIEKLKDIINANR